MSTGINKADVMHLAWSIYRTCHYENERRALAKGFRANRTRWSNALKAAWSILKERARVAALDAAARAAEARANMEARLLDAEMAEPAHRGPMHFATIHNARMALAAS